MSFNQIEREYFKRKQEKLVELEKQKSKIDEEIRALSSTATGVKPQETIATVNLSTSEKDSKKTARKSMSKNKVIRAVNDKPLKDLLLDIAADNQPRTTSEFLTKLENNGWKTTSAKPYHVIFAQLTTLEKKNLLQRVGRGTYQMVKGEPVVEAQAR